MKKGAVFRMVLPDLEQCIKNYASGGGEIPSRAKEFMEQTGLGQLKRPRRLYSLVIESFGNSRHRWMWDFSSLHYELEKIGFQNIRRAQFEDSNDKMFKMVEQKERWRNALSIDCIK
jgi:hypothetical protein